MLLTGLIEAIQLYNKVPKTSVL